MTDLLTQMVAVVHTHDVTLIMTDMMNGMNDHASVTVTLVWQKREDKLKMILGNNR